MAKRKKPSEVQKMFCDTIRQANTIKTSCQRAGISEPTFNRWMVKGEEDFYKRKKTEYKNFYEAVEEAQGFAKAYLLQGIRKAGDMGDWKAMAWILERTYHKDYGKKETTEITGKDGGAIEFQDSGGKEKLYNKLIQTIKRETTKTDDKPTYREGSLRNHL